MASKISQYLGSQAFRDAANKAVSEAIAVVESRGAVAACEPSPEAPAKAEVVRISLDNSGEASKHLYDFLHKKQ